MLTLRTSIFKQVVKDGSVTNANLFLGERTNWQGTLKLSMTRLETSNALNARLHPLEGKAWHFMLGPFTRRIKIINVTCVNMLLQIRGVL